LVVAVEAVPAALMDWPQGDLQAVVLFWHQQVSAAPTAVTELPAVVVVDQAVPVCCLSMAQS
jgi:hypothetical protein